MKKTNDIKSISDDGLLEIARKKRAELYKNEIRAKKIIRAIDRTICACEQNPQNMMYTAVELKVLLEDLEIKGFCRVYVDLENFKLRLLPYDNKPDEEQEEME